MAESTSHIFFNGKIIGSARDLVIQDSASRPREELLPKKLSVEFNGLDGDLSALSTLFSTTQTAVSLRHRGVLLRGYVEGSRMTYLRGSITLDLDVVLDQRSGKIARLFKLLSSLPRREIRRCARIARRFFVYYAGAAPRRKHWKPSEGELDRYIVMCALLGERPRIPRSLRDGR